MSVVSSIYKCSQFNISDLQRAVLLGDDVGAGGQRGGGGEEEGGHQQPGRRRQREHGGAAAPDCLHVGRGGDAVAAASNYILKYWMLCEQCKVR